MCLRHGSAHVHGTGWQYVFLTTLVTRRLSTITTPTLRLWQLHVPNLALHSERDEKRGDCLPRALIRLTLILCQTLGEHGS